MDVDFTSRWARKREMSPLADTSNREGRVAYIYIYFLKFLQLFKKWLINRSYALNLSSCEVKAGKKSGLKGIRTMHDLCDTGRGARFSKLLVITGPVKLFCFPF